MTIEFDLSPKSIEGAIHRVELYSKDLEKKTEILVDKLAEEVKANAERELISKANGDEQFDTTFDSLAIEKAGKYTRNILAGGDAVWLEFGTGVVANNCAVGDFVHPMPGVYFKINGIGTYGKGKGAQPYGWWYTSKSGESVHTYGIPATMFMYNSAREVRAKIPNIARGLFKT